MINKKGLGKGLSALITQGNIETDKQDTGVIQVDINRIEPNRDQPRKYFNENTLAELASSIQEFGIIQPLIVKEEGDNYYSIIAGERRWRAARLAKLSTLPVIIKEYTKTDALQVALIENLQREDLNPIEEAQCYKRLIDEFFFKQEDVADKVGKKRNLISYSLSLLNLDKRVQNFVIEGRVSASHARCLLSIENAEEQLHFAEKVIEDDLSLKELEKLIKQYFSSNRDKEDNKKTYAEYTSIEADLKQIMGTKVSIKDGKNKGKIEIEYYSKEELDRLVLILKNGNN